MRWPWRRRRRPPDVQSHLAEAEARLRADRAERPELQRLVDEARRLARPATRDVYGADVRRAREGRA